MSTTKKDTTLSVSRGNVNPTDNKDYSKMVTEVAERKDKHTVLVFESEDAEQHEVLNTPFSIGRRKNEWLVLLGNQILVGEIKSRTEALKEAKKIDWNKISQLIWEMIKKTTEINNLRQN